MHVLSGYGTGKRWKTAGKATYTGRRLGKVVAHRRQKGVGKRSKRRRVMHELNTLCVGRRPMVLLPHECKYLDSLTFSQDCTRDIEQAIKIRPVSNVFKLNRRRCVPSIHVRFFHINLIVTLAGRVLLVFDGIPGQRGLIKIRTSWPKILARTKGFAPLSFRKALGAGGKATQPLWSMQEVEGKMGFALYGTDGYDPRKS
ncbi:hypothetical protein B0H13DRAFT_1899617 [Mycena leptocephala]|nr:hypothetical protein B0H13DRAFT_1899617 [Mycena leptocephala]